eukprot:TRINITY_DN231_c0_g1_i2.p1 TRINITY_DN231_c0_g1~~TRINITY_DN231_c0_g1_i2.p1  ORF type:complete len:338 (-),score=115.87 TRINITY_DN231_c0_g1_i2:90-1046(-)
MALVRRVSRLLRPLALQSRAIPLSFSLNHKKISAISSFFSTSSQEPTPVVLNPVSHKVPTNLYVEPELKVWSTSLISNEKKEEITLDSRVFGIPLRKDILQRVVEWQRAKRRKGTYAAKGRGEVSGSTIKMRRQKHTGSARAGSKRPPHWRHGGVAHAPKPRSFAIDLPRKVRQLGLKITLSQKLKEGTLRIISDIDIPAEKVGERDVYKTKHLVRALEAQGIKSAFIVDGHQVDRRLEMAAGNIPNVQVVPQLGATVYDILRHDYLFLTRAALDALVLRLTTRVSSPAFLQKKQIEQERMIRHQKQLEALRQEQQQN